MRILLTGASGKLGSYLLQHLQSSPHAVVAWSGTQAGKYFDIPLEAVDLADRSAIENAFKRAKPDAVIHTAARSSVAECLEKPDLAQSVNVHATALLADLAAQQSSRMVHVSTDMVFNGGQGNYSEQAEPAPLSSYGRSKLAAEEPVLVHPSHVVVRVALLFGPTIVGRPAFFDQMQTAVRESQPFRLFHDEWRTPLSLRTAAQHLLAAADDAASGVFHLGGPERMSRLEMGQRLAAHLGLSAECLVSTSLADATAPEPRPADLSLDSSRWQTAFPHTARPQFEEALAEMGIAGNAR